MHPPAGGGGWETGPRYRMFSKKERTPSAACPACKAPDLIVERPLVRSDALGMWTSGGVCACGQCLTRFLVIEGKVSVPSWIAERNRKQDEAESIASLREKFRKDNPPAMIERDMKWPT
jgi:hypothetical protein